MLIWVGAQTKDVTRGAIDTFGVDQGVDGVKGTKHLSHEGFYGKYDCHTTPSPV